MKSRKSRRRAIGHPRCAARLEHHTIRTIVLPREYSHMLQKANPTK